MNILEEERIKITILGKSVGKTSLIYSFLGRRQIKEYDSSTTSAPRFFEKCIIIGNKKYNIELWDSASQEKYYSINKLFMKATNIIILVYDITSLETFEELPFISQSFQDIILEATIIGVIGNKKDLYFRKKVNEERAKEYANKINAFFTLTSAKDDPFSFYSFIIDLLIEYIKKKGGVVNDNDINNLKMKYGKNSGFLKDKDIKKLKMKNRKNEIILKTII